MHRWGAKDSFPYVITIFSAPNYCGEFDNAGAVRRNARPQKEPSTSVQMPCMCVPEPDLPRDVDTSIKYNV